MKTLFSLILLLIVVLGSAAQNSVHAENDDPCKNPNDKTWCAIKSIANEAKDLSDYYDTAKNAIEIPRIRCVKDLKV